MSIYVGDKKAKLYRGDYCPAQLYKGDVKIAGYTDHEKVGTQISGVDTYNDALNLTIDGKSEQTVTVQGKNLFDEERILPTQGWVKQNDGSFFVSNNSIPYGKVLWENTDGYTGQIFVTIQNRRTEVGSQYTGAFPAIVYTDGSRSIALDFRDVAWTSNQVISDNTKTVKQIQWSYGTGAIGTYVKDLLIAKSNTIVPYQPFVPNSPSPDYPEPIRSSENFDVVSCGRNLFPSLQKEKLLSNALIVNLKLGSTVQITGCNFQNGEIVVPANSRIVIAGSWSDDASDLRNRPQWVGLKPNTQYVLKAKILPFSGQIYRLFAKGNFEYSALPNGYIIQHFTTTAQGIYTYGIEEFIYILRGGIYLPDELVISDIQLEEGTTSTPYQPYHATTAHVTDPLRSVGDVADSIEVSEGKAEVVRRCGLKALDGSEAWTIYNAGAGAELGYTVFFTSLSQIGVAPDFHVSICTNALWWKYGYANSISGNCHSLTSNGATLMFKTNLSMTATVTSFREWLASQATAGTPVTILYQLATPTRTDITTTPLGQEFLALRTQPRYTQVYTNATLPPTLRAKIKEMEL